MTKVISIPPVPYVTESTFLGDIAVKAENTVQRVVNDVVPNSKGYFNPFALVTTQSLHSNKKLVIPTEVANAYARAHGIKI